MCPCKAHFLSDEFSLLRYDPFAHMQILDERNPCHASAVREVRIIGTFIFVHRDNYGSFEYDLIDKEKTDVIVFQTAE